MSEHAMPLRQERHDEVLDLGLGRFVAFEQIVQLHLLPRDLEEILNSDRKREILF